MSGSCSLASPVWRRVVVAPGDLVGLGPPREGNPVPESEGHQSSADDERRRLQALIEPEGVESARVVPDPLDRLCRVVTSDLVLEGAVVTLMPTLSTHVVVATSSESTRLHEEAQFGLGEGPTQDAYSGGRPVVVADMGLSAMERWPGYSRAALAAGVRGFYAFRSM